ncbi:indole-3-glycerol phosphate synthase TrpC [Thiotrichales bacterium 19S3-7]|nr:indole-3-glycerol phosphate synthase TrpC [Thiotrichales bacterium 19S3-7]MCF6801649.1 indole-3-glycerol phosphate synthase TrpC [Thiotrichales bacterium 19S3-11]
MKILDTIVKKKKEEINEIELIAKTTLAQNNNDFLSAILNKKYAIIAELKSKSPSEGIICENYNPVAIAKLYEKGGACCISVLTDHSFFNGSFDDLKQVSKNTNLPTLCKDFIIDKRQVYLARAAGASACLLIVRILTDQQLISLKNEIESLGMTALIEIFDQHDLIRALKIQPKLIGINNRNLDSLKMDHDNATNLKSSLPNDVLTLSLSGAKSAKDIYQAAHQFDGVLVGTLLMRSKSPDMTLRAVFEQEA